jgi:signal transduction histidine kinase
MTLLSPSPTEPAATDPARRVEALGRLTGEIAHEFNNLLHVINMNLELIAMLAKEEKLAPAIERARTAARRGARLTSQLISFSRKQPHQAGSVHVNKLLADMKEIMEIAAGSNVVIELEMGEQRSPMVLDPIGFELSMIDLAINARTAMPQGGTLKVSTCEGERPPKEKPLKASGQVVVTVTPLSDELAQSLELVFASRPTT